MSAKHPAPDPIQRVLRVVAAAAALVVFVIIALDAGRGDDVGVLGIAAGVLLVLLGYEGIVRLPEFLQRRNGGSTEEEEQ